MKLINWLNYLNLIGWFSFVRFIYRSLIGGTLWSLLQWVIASKLLEINFISIYIKIKSNKKNYKSLLSYFHKVNFNVLWSLKRMLIFKVDIRTFLFLSVRPQSPVCKQHTWLTSPSRLGLISRHRATGFNQSASNKAVLC